MIRAACEADFAAMIAVGREYYAASPNAAYAPLCEDTCAATLRLLLDAGIVLAAELDGAVVGLLAVVLAPSVINRAVVGASEVYFFVSRAAAGRGIGRALLDAMTAQCRARGLAFLQMHSTSGSPPQLEALYAASGFAPTEASFTRVL